MMPTDEIDQKAADWLSESVVAKLRYGQDYSFCYGHSKKLMDGEKQTGISIARPYMRLFATGYTKLFRIAVLGEELPDVEYSKAEEAKIDADIEKAEAKHKEIGGYDD